MADTVTGANIADAFAARQQTETAERFEVLRRLATGLLRRTRGAVADPIFGALAALLGVDEAAQCAQKTVDWYLFGRAGSPPFPEAPQMRGAAAQVLEGRLHRAATDAELDVIVFAIPGAENDLVLAPSPMKNMLITRALAEAYADGI